MAMYSQDSAKVGCLLGIGVDDSLTITTPTLVLPGETVATVGVTNLALLWLFFVELIFGTWISSSGLLKEK